MTSNRNRMIASLALVLILLMALFSPVWAQGPVTQIRNAVITTLSVLGNSTIAGTVTTGGSVTVGDDLTITDDAVFGSDITASPQATVTLTMNGSIVPTGSFMRVSSAGAVSISGANITAGTAGDVLVLLNVGSQTITISETTGLVSAGNIVLGTLDSATLIYQGASWYQVGASNN